MVFSGFYPPFTEPQEPNASTPIFITLGDKDEHMHRYQAMKSYKKISKEKREFGDYIIKILPGGTHYICKQ
jgi:predicted esterase